MENEKVSRWRLRPPFICLTVMVLLPIAWWGVIGVLEFAGKKDLALGLGWLTIPIILPMIPIGLLLTLILSVKERRRK